MQVLFFVGAREKHETLKLLCLLGEGCTLCTLGALKRSSF